MALGQGRDGCSPGSSDQGAEIVHMNTALDRARSQDDTHGGGGSVDRKTFGVTAMAPTLRLGICEVVARRSEFVRDFSRAVRRLAERTTTTSSCLGHIDGAFKYKSDTAP
jgi:hypothetical protein